MEIETNGKIPFLDLMVTRDNNQQIHTEWYMKPTSTGRIMNYKSNCHMNIQINTALGLINRVFQLDKTNTEAKKTEIVIKTLSSNDYPKNLIHHLIKRYKNNTNKLDNTYNTNLLKYRSIPYVKGLSEKVSKMMKNNVENLFCTFKGKKSEIFTKLKDKTDPLLKTNLIYSIPCAADDCNGQ
jgi:hypothetical protein